MTEIIVNLRQLFPGLSNKERFPVGKTKWVWEASLRCHTFCEVVYQFSSHK